VDIVFDGQVVLLTRVASLSRSIPEDIQAPPIKRAATDNLSIKIKRERDEDYPSIASAIRPKKHRRTVSEQIVPPSNLKDSTSVPSPLSILSPRSPAPERVNRALTDRIQHLKDENAGLKASVTGLETEKTDLQKRMEKESHAYRGLQIESDALKKESENMRKEMMAMKERLETVETSGEKLRVQVDRLTAVEEASKELRKELRNEVEKLRGRVERSEKEAENAKEELLAVRRGLTKELGEAVKKWGA
jgi:DNA repair exonuclease SbcCD ATPase subunit